MTHYMNLASSSFQKIANGSKTIELRLYDEKRRKINIGDIIIFYCIGNQHSIKMQVKHLYIFNNFEELYRALPLRLCGYSENELDMAHYSDMELYYSKEQICKYGVVGIELNNIP